MRISDLQRYSEVNVKVKCDYCGYEFTQTYSHYIDSLKHIHKSACKNCVGLKCAEITLNKRRNNLYDKLISLCDKIGYKLLTPITDIINNQSYIRYVCPQHGEQTIRINNLINGRRCPLCSIEKKSKTYRLSDECVNNNIEKCGGVWINKGEYKNRYEKNLLIRCPICGEPFYTSYVLFTQHGGQVCDNCKSDSSLGEQKIENFLRKSNISFKKEYWFKDCRDVNPLPFDFYLDDYNMVIEFDGRQHFGETNYFTYTYEQTKMHDNIKNDYCNNNNIKMVRIPYWKINKVDDILSNEIHS